MTIQFSLPEFHHPEVNAFYEYDCSIPKEKVAQILALPRETLVKDMELIIEDCIKRQDFFTKHYDENEDDWLEMLKHALWVLAELKATEALPTVLKILQQDDDFCSLWFEDYATENFWQDLYLLGDQHLEELRQAVLMSGDWALRAAAGTAIEQIGLHQPERRPEIIKWYESVFEAFIAMKDDDPALDYGLISSLVANLISLNGVELLPQIRLLDQKDLIDYMHAGNPDSIEKYMKEPNQTWRKNELPENIYQRYETVMQWHGYLLKYDLAYQEAERRENIEWELAQEKRRKLEAEKERKKPNFIHTSGTFVRGSVKLGRNDPCVCGSGKKYKRCCLGK